MRSLAVCCILVALAIVAPPASLRTEAEGLWGLGLLVLFGVTGQNVARRLRLPPLTGWVAAGLVMGSSLLGAAEPQRVPLLRLAADLAGLWAGLLVALGVSWPIDRRTWKLPGIVAGSTAVGVALVAGGIALTTDLPPLPLLVIAALAGLWGPLVTDTWGDHDTRLVTLTGTGVAFVVLGGVLVLAAPGGGHEWVARLWGGGAVGAVTAEVFWRLGVFHRRAPALLALTAATVAATLTAGHVGVPTVPIGLGAGLVLAAHEDPGRQLGHLLAPARSRAVLLFAGLLVAGVDVMASWPLPAGLLEILGVQLAVLVLLRGVAPLLWHPMRPDGGTPGGTWRILPRGLLAGELVLAAGATLPALLSPEAARLMRTVVLADLVLAGLVIGALVLLLPPPPATAETEMPSGAEATAAD